MKRYGVVCARGIGDGLLGLVLSYNLQRAGYCVTTFSTPLTQLSNWFPSHTLLPFPSHEECEKVFGGFDRVFALCGERFKNCSSLDHVTFLEEKAFDRKQSMIDNLVNYCGQKLQLRTLTRENGIIIPSHIQKRHHDKRVILHPMSSDPKKNWLPQKFLTLATTLLETGWSPVLMMSEEERKAWKPILSLQKIEIPCPIFSTLADAASFLAESGYLIGNDSGVGHLASNLKLPTLTLFSKKSSSYFWRPAWGMNRTLVPSFFLVSGRLREKKWKDVLTVGKVLRNFKKLHQESEKRLSLKKLY